MKNHQSITAVVLCGGRGERLRPITEHIPKPLVPLNGQPILLHLLRYLATFGVQRFVLCTGYKAELIEEFARTLPESWNVRCVFSGDVSGDATMVQRLRDAWPFVEGQALICYGDTLANVDLTRLVNHHHRHGRLATMTVYRLPSPYGIIRINRDGLVTKFDEKPLLPHWINIGFLLCDPGPIRPSLDKAVDMVPFLEDLCRESQLTAYKHLGRHLTVNTEKERQSAEVEVVRFLSVLDG